MSAAKYLTGELGKQADGLSALYEQKRAALLPVLRLIQETYGYIPEASHGEIADYFGVPLSDIKEVLTFYTLFYSREKGRFHFQVCRNLSCTLMGGEEILAHLQKKLGIGTDETSPDGKFSLSVVECLCACDQAPMLQLNRRDVGRLTRERIDELIDGCV